jgi:hypothetical protein
MNIVTVLDERGDAVNLFRATPTHFREELIPQTTNVSDPSDLPGMGRPCTDDRSYVPEMPLRPRKCKIPLDKLWTLPLLSQARNHLIL